MIIYIVEAIVCGLLYRLGGIGKPFPTRLRDLGIPIVFLGIMFFHGMWTWWALLAAVLLLGALSTYWDWLFGEDNLYFHGFACGLAMLPLCFAGVSLREIGIYSICLSLVMGLLNTVCNKFHVKHSDWVEEIGRGMIIRLALPLLFLFK